MILSSFSPCKLWLLTNVIHPVPEKEKIEIWVSVIVTWSIMGINPIARARRNDPVSTGSYTIIISCLKFASLHEQLKLMKGEREHLHEYQDIYRITVFTNGSRNKAVVVWVHNGWVQDTINLKRKKKHIKRKTSLHICNDTYNHRNKQQVRKLKSSKDAVP